MSSIDKVKMDIPESGVLSNEIFFSLKAPLWDILHEMGCEIGQKSKENSRHIVFPSGWVLDQNNPCLIRDHMRQARIEVDPGISFFGMGSGPQTILNTRFKIDLYISGPDPHPENIPMLLLFIRDTDQNSMPTLNVDRILSMKNGRYMSSRFGRRLNNSCWQVLKSLKDVLCLDDPLALWDVDAREKVFKAIDVVDDKLRDFPQLAIVASDPVRNNKIVNSTPPPLPSP